MSSAREMRLRIRSVKNITQVTRAMETVSASKVRRAMAMVQATGPYAEKSWKVLVHLARQPGHNSLHPLLSERPVVKNILVLMVSGDRGLAGPYYVNILRSTLDKFYKLEQPVSYVIIGRKGRELLMRLRQNIIADFSDLPTPPSFQDVSAIGRLLVQEFLSNKFDQIYISYTDFQNMLIQKPVIRKLLPLEVVIDSGHRHGENITHSLSKAVFNYEPEQDEILDEIIPRFTAIQVYQSILESQASEQAARMIAMRNATDNGIDLLHELELQYNKARQQAITNEMLDIAGGAEALASA
jgi:F-type H+-transporting ATPase subunit gamma